MFLLCLFFDTIRKCRNHEILTIMKISVLSNFESILTIFIMMYVGKDIKTNAYSFNELKRSIISEISLIISSCAPLHFVKIEQQDVAQYLKPYYLFLVNRYRF